MGQGSWLEKMTRSVEEGIPTRSVGTSKTGINKWEW
jgi:hypothetical protein